MCKPAYSSYIASAQNVIILCIMSIVYPFPDITVNKGITHGGSISILT